MFKIQKSLLLFILALTSFVFSVHAQNTLGDKCDTIKSQINSAGGDTKACVDSAHINGNYYKKPSEEMHAMFRQKDGKFVCFALKDQWVDKYGTFGQHKKTNSTFEKINEGVVHKHLITNNEKLKDDETIFFMLWEHRSRNGDQKMHLHLKGVENTNNPDDKYRKITNSHMCTYDPVSKFLSGAFVVIYEVPKDLCSPSSISSMEANLVSHHQLINDLNTQIYNNPGLRDVIMPTIQGIIAKIELIEMRLTLCCKPPVRN